MQKTDFSPRSSDAEIERRQSFTSLFLETPIAKGDLVYSQLSLYITRQEFSRMLFLADLYRSQVLQTNGILLEFGTCYGRTASILTNLRGIFEPYNFTRRLAIFDTFSGLRGVSRQDGVDPLAVENAYSAGEGYENHLLQVLSYHESEAPISHIRKFEIVKGDASVTLPLFLNENPEAIVALAYFDFDIYAPTKACLDAVKPRLTKGSVLIFDQLNCHGFPGETIALAEFAGLNSLRIRRSPLTPWISYVLGEDFL